jgi:hypothetical protein
VSDRPFFIPERVMKWFRHDTDMRKNPKVRMVIRTHGVTGYGIWSALLEELYTHEEGFQVEATPLWLATFADDLRITDDRTLTRVFDTFAELGLISAQLWAEGVLYCEAITKRGDAYIKQRTYEAEKKRNQRAKEKELSLGTNKGQRDKVPMSPPQISDLQISELQNSDLQISHTDPERRVCAIEEIEIQDRPEPETEPLPKFKPSTESSEARFRPPAAWRLSNKRNDFEPGFVESVRLYMADLPSYKGKKVTTAEGKGWIAKREFDEQGLAEIEIRWEVYTQAIAAKQQAEERRRAAEQQRLEQQRQQTIEHSPDELAAIARRQHLSRLRVKATLPGERAKAIQEALSIGATLADIGLEEATP